MSFPAKALVIFSIIISFSLVISPAKADAHGIGGIGPSKTTAQVVSIEPRSSTFAVKSIENGNRFKVTRTSNEDVVVLGVDDEPYLQLTEEGVFVNKKSATRLINQSNTSTKSAETISKEFEATSSDPNAKPSWEKIASGSSYAFHDHRTHYMGSVPDGTVDLGISQLKLRVSDQIYTVTLEFKSRATSFLNGLLIGLLLTMTAVGVFGYLFRERFSKIFTRKLLVAALAIICILELAHIYGYSRFSEQSTMSVLSASLYGIIFLLLTAFSLHRLIFKGKETAWESTLSKHAPLFCATGFMGFSAGTLLEYRILIDPYLPTSFPGWFSRISIMVVGIISVAIFTLGLSKIKQPVYTEAQSSTVLD